MKKTAVLSFTLAIFLTGFLPVYADDINMSNSSSLSSVNAQAKVSEAVGIVDEIDAATSVVTISHEAIKNLGWPAMTMNFVVKDKKLLNKLGKGKKVHFSLIEQRGEYVITDVK